MIASEQMTEIVFEETNEKIFYVHVFVFGKAIENFVDPLGIMFSEEQEFYFSSMVPVPVSLLSLILDAWSHFEKEVLNATKKTVD